MAMQKTKVVSRTIQASKEESPPALRIDDGKTNLSRAEWDETSELGEWEECFMNNCSEFNCPKWNLSKVKERARKSFYSSLNRESIFDPGVRVVRLLLLLYLPIATPLTTTGTTQPEDTMKANCFDNTAPPRWQASQGMEAIDFPPGEEIDRMVAQAMLELSAEEREKALQEIHGVVEVDEEDPDFMASCLDELDNYLAATKSGTAYELAEQMNYDYVSNNRFRTMFLRSTRYVPQDAAEKLIGFLDYKKELFGVENLVHDITLDDLSPDDRALMEVGYVQFGKTHDRNGRPILCLCEKVKLRYSKSAENSVRHEDCHPSLFVCFNVLNPVFYFLALFCDDYLYM
eukprot:scaffold9290_cov107-Cylindrotheca_fusiformis.AAC.9